MKQILVAIDFSDVTELVIEAAAQLAADTESQVCVVHAELPDPEIIGFEAGPVIFREQAARQIRSHMRELDKVSRELKTRGIETQCMDLQGHIVDKIVQEAEHFNADVIVIGSHEHGAFHHLIFGSVRDSLIKRAPCPVLICPYHTRQKIL